VGVIPKANVGAEYLLTGEWEENLKFGGWQFVFKSYECFVNSQHGLKELLVRECKHIGPQLASRLVNKFGDKTMHVLCTDPASLTLVAGVSQNIALAVNEWAKAERSNLQLKERLYAIGMLPNQVEKVINQYGHNAEEKIRKDCFSLTEIKGFGFKTVAKIADLLGVPKTDPGRIKAAILYQLNESCEEGGHTHLPASELIREVAILCEIGQQSIEPVLEAMIKKGELLTNETDWKAYSESNGLVLS